MDGFDEINFYSGNALDRISELRSNTSWLLENLITDRTKFILFQNIRPLVEKYNDSFNLCLFDFKSVEEIVLNIAGGDLENLRSRWSSQLLLIGREWSSDQSVWYAINVADHTSYFPELLKNGDRCFISSWTDLLSVNSKHASIISQVKSMFHWLDRYRFCATCGKEMEAKDAGYKRNCISDSCRSNKGVHNTCYPRTDPSVIMCIVSKDGEKYLLGRKSGWPMKSYSCLAGFVEPGESVEDAVIRETKEESGIDVGNIVYVSSQPWPFPSSLMIGCTAVALSEKVTICEEEMEDVCWFSKKEVLLALDGKSNLLLIPPKQTIAHSLIRWRACSNP